MECIRKYWVFFKQKKTGIKKGENGMSRKQTRILLKDWIIFMCKRCQRILCATTKYIHLFDEVLFSPKTSFSLIENKFPVLFFSSFNGFYYILLSKNVAYNLQYMYKKKFYTKWKAKFLYRPENNEVTIIR